MEDGIVIICIRSWLELVMILHSIDWEQIDWGTVPEWFAAFGTIGAVATALLVSHRDARRLDDERRDAKRDREAAAIERAESAEDRRRLRAEQDEISFIRKREFAQYVTVNVGLNDTVPLVDTPETAEVVSETQFKCSVLITNYGTTPVFDVKTSIPKFDPYEYQMGDGSWSKLVPASLPLIRPGSTYTHNLKIRLTDLLTLQNQTVVAFRDARGQYWETTHHGSLTSINRESKDVQD
ncbi:hypothetical protein [Micrococcus sp. IITD107]|uniref:hypothetical protein n=1 Tax=Micrococcus sp. IITD107 TaxID=3342790 RepID=UPI0035B84F08